MPRGYRNNNNGRNRRPFPYSRHASIGLPRGPNFRAQNRVAPTQPQAQPIPADTVARQIREPSPEKLTGDARAVLNSAKRAPQKPTHQSESINVKKQSNFEKRPAGNKRDQEEELKRLDAELNAYNKSRPVVKAAPELIVIQDSAESIELLPAPLDEPVTNWKEKYLQVKAERDELKLRVEHLGRSRISCF